MKIKLTNIYEGSTSKYREDTNKFTVEVVSDSDPTLTELIELFEGFVHACGYRLPIGHRIDIVPEDN